MAGLNERLQQMISSPAMPGGYNRTATSPMNPRTLGGLEPIQPMQGLGGALQKRQQMAQNPPVYQELQNEQPYKYAGKARGGAAVGLVLKGAARFLQAIENTKALKLQQMRYEELYQLSIKKENHQMQMEAADKLIQLQKMEQENNKTIQAFVDNVSQTAGGMTREQQPGYLEGQLRATEATYGEESAQATALRALMQYSADEEGATPATIDTSAFPDLTSTEKAKAKATKLGTEEGEVEAWKTGGSKEMFAEQEWIKAEKSEAAKQTAKTGKEKEAEDLKIENARLLALKRQRDLDESDTQKAVKMLMSGMYPLTMMNKSEDEIVADVTKFSNVISTIYGKGKATDTNTAEIADIKSYGDKETALSAIAGKPFTPEKKQQILKAIEEIDKNKLWEQMNAPVE